jgi:hypothetical protein
MSLVFCFVQENLKGRKGMDNLIHFSADMTLHWSFSESDLLVWMRWENIFTERTVEIVNVWEMRDGDHVTITNRIEDLPIWFKLHPSEASGIMSNKMLALLDKGYQVPPNPLAGPNIWRPASGDRLVWMGQTRNAQKNENGILSIISFDQCALVLGESNRTGRDPSISFGSWTKEELDPMDLTPCKHAVHVVKQMGIPSRMRFRWGLGS